MYSSPQSATPAVKNHLEAQLSYFNALSKSLFGTVQHYTDLNIQLAQTLLEESTQAGQHALLAKNGVEQIAAVAAHLRPAAEKVRAYHRHVTQLASDTQVDLADVSEQHITETSRTAKELASEVQRIASEETDKNLRAQQDAVRNFADPFKEVAEAFHSGKSRQPTPGGNGSDGGKASASTAPVKPPGTPAPH